MKLVALLAGLTLSATSMADPVMPGVTATFNASGVTVMHAAPGAPRAAAAQPKRAEGTVIYSNFNADEANLYDCCNGYTVRGAAVGLGYQRMAMPFTPTTDTHLRSVVVAISRAGGINRLTGTLQEDDNGLPGKVIREVIIQNFPDLGTCCETEAVDGRAIPLQAGKTYWIVATPKDLSALAWNHSNNGTVGPGAFDTGSGWQSFTDMQGAFSVIGD